MGAGTKHTGMVFVVGGARSGKSRFAEEVASRPGGRRLYVATAEALDVEMAARIEKHRARRGADWDTVEAPADPAGALSDALGGGEYSSVLVDCLTLWLSNRLGAGLADDDIMAEARAFADACREAAPLVVVVSNEVGLGIVPAGELSRRFTDLAGLVNQHFADAADAAYFTAAGIPLRLK